MRIILRFCGELLGLSLTRLGKPDFFNSQKRRATTDAPPTPSTRLGTLSILRQHERPRPHQIPEDERRRQHQCRGSDHTNDDEGRLLLVQVHAEEAADHGPGAHHGAVGVWGDGPQFRQESAHPHGVAVFDDTLYVADLGTNEVVSWSIDYEAGTLRQADNVTVHELAGPRHVQVTQNGHWAFALNELDNTLSVFRRDSEGKLKPTQTLSSLPEGWAEQNTDPATFPNEVYSKPSHASQLLISPDDRFVYASNRGHDSIAVFSIDEATESIETVQIEPSLGRIPWVCSFSHDSRFVLVQNNHTRANETGPDSVVVFQRNVDSGRLTPKPARLEFPSVSSLWMLPDTY